MSARKMMALTVTFTYCACVIGACVLTVIKIIDLPVFLALFSGFSGNAMYIWKSYFDRTDRKGDQDEKSINNGSSTVVHSNN